MIDYSFLQHYWWFIISLIGGIFAFLMFVQGGQSMLFSLGKEDKHRFLMVNALGRKWEYTFTTLVTFGGALFASFPLFYSTSFGGAYWVWMLILFCFVIQAVSYEYMSKPGNTWGKKTYQVFLFLNGLLGTFLVGVAIATFFTGAEFAVNKGNIANLGVENVTGVVISQWQNPLHGLEALGDFRNWCLGFAVFFLTRTIACLFFINRLDDQELVARSRKFLIYNALPFVVFFLVFVIWTLLSTGYSVNPETKAIIEGVANKYFWNLVELPVVGIVFLIGVVLVLYGIIRTILSTSFTSGVWFSGVGTVLTVCALLLITGFNNTPYYPSSVNPQSSLTLQNSSSSEFTLTAMFYVSLLVPFVLAYIIYAWNALEKKKFKKEDLKEDGHVY
ncbi:cytochrome d ubiquinol oxidase subunit II [Dysgonomonas macrotermitis]|uniref:Cytochrome d ubiquinol oxidase subunit II n=1 Tax=Dysgonomonas macrotermitis TaxID=1346286 RepID=A0A1M5DY27_9BACT|nr:cytochrome d ubiquinol oxidase subunit II [Dysgonomonas macrotermitis]SHF71816.1 cytochrome d ubiquinol oxidase subunit II [Dysgonomonas macrotermitis]